VCPSVLETGLYTVAAADNTDHNLGSATAHLSFHRTDISLTQFAVVQSETIQQKLSPDLQSASGAVETLLVKRSRKTAYSLCMTVVSGVGSEVVMNQLLCGHHCHDC